MLETAVVMAEIDHGETTANVFIDDNLNPQVLVSAAEKQRAAANAERLAKAEARIQEKVRSRLPREK